MNQRARSPDSALHRWIADRMVDILRALMVDSMVSAVGMALLGNVMIRLF